MRLHCCYVYILHPVEDIFNYVLVIIIYDICVYYIVLLLTFASIGCIVWLRGDIMDYKKVFAQRLVQLREDKGITQSQLAEMVGVSPQTISAYEKNRGKDSGKMPTLSTVIEIADKLGVSLDYLCGREKNMPQTAKLETLADIVVLFSELELGHNLSCYTTISSYELDFDEWIRDGENDEVVEKHGLQAQFVVKNGTLAAFYEKERRMTDLLRDKIIDKDLYDSWHVGEMKKLEEWSIAADSSLPF